MEPLRWQCPAGWVAFARGGCGPAAFLCAPEGGAAPRACNDIDPTEPPTLSDVDGAPFTGIARALDGTLIGGWPTPGSKGGPPAIDWMPPPPEGVPEVDWRPTPPTGSCPMGWTGNVASGCSPALRSDCPEGSAALPGARCLPLGPSACPDGVWPLADAGAPAERVVHVRAGSAAMGADGSESRPFPTLSSAFARAIGEAWVLLAEGEYVLPEVLPSQVHLLGVCAARVTLTTPPAPAEARVAFAISGAGASLELRDVTLRSRDTAVRVTMGAHASLRRVHVSEAWVGGVMAVQGARVEIEDSLIEGVRARGVDGRGIIADSATVSARRVVVRAIEGRGVIASGLTTATSLLFEDSVVRDLASSLNGAVAIDVNTGARATLRRVALSALRDAGLLVGVLQTRVTATDLSIADVGIGRPGFGVQVDGGGSFAAERMSIHHVRGVGLFVNSARSVATLDDCVLADIEGAPGSGLGVAVRIQNAGRFTGRRIRIESTTGAALVATGAGSVAEFEHAAILRPGSDVHAAVGAQGGATITLRETRIERGRGSLVVAEGAGSRLVAEGVAIEDCLPVDGEQGVAFFGLDGASLDLARIRLTNVAALGVNVIDAGPLSLRDAIFDGALTAGTRLPGVVVHGGEPATLLRVVLRNHGLAGAQSESGAALTIEDSLVEDVVVGSSPDFVLGVSVVDGSELTLRRSVVARSAGTLVNATGHATLEDCVLRDSTPAASGLNGRGIGVENPGSADATRVLISRAHELAVGVFGEGTRLRLTDSVITDTLGGRMGASVGVFVKQAGVAELERVSITRSIGYGVTVSEEGSAVSLRSVVVRETLPWRFGLSQGIHLRDGARASLAGTLIEDSRGYGLWAVGAGTSVQLDEVFVRDSRSTEPGGFGVGISSYFGASVVGRRITVEDVHGAALLSVPEVNESDGSTAGRGGSAMDLRDVFVRGVTASAIEGGARPRIASYGLHVGSGCTASVSNFVVDDVGWGFFQNAGAMTLSRGVISRWRDGAGASNGVTSALASRFDDVRAEPNGSFARDVMLPPVLLPPPPDACALPPCER